MDAAHATRVLHAYAAKAGVDANAVHLGSAALEVVSLFETAKNALLPPMDDAAVEKLFCYRVPLSGPDGACSLSKALDPVPFDIAQDVLGRAFSSPGVASSPLALRLYRLNELMRGLARITGFDWVGVYRAVDGKDGSAPYLLKEAYVGAPSRAKFPLTKEFAEFSNNSTVGLSGKALLVQSVGDYEGPYYVCDARVQSELCAPIFSADGARVAGIIDAEAFAASFLTPDRVACVLLACALLGASDLMTHVTQ